jgi:hypothetical protein
MAALLAAAVVGYFVCFPLMDTDIWWHLAAGRLMVEEHRFIFSDPFAADTLGKPWVDVHWLFQILVYWLHRSGGIAALVLAKIALVGLGVALATRAICMEIPRWLFLPAALAVSGFLFPARHLVLTRPTVVTLVLLTATLLILEHVRRTERLRWALLLLPVQVFWANVQGLYLLEPGVLACVVVGDAIAGVLLARTPGLGLHPPPARRVTVGLAVMLPVLVGAAAITPYGWDGLRLPFRLLGRIDSISGQVFSREVSENLAPWLLERGSSGELSAFKWLAALTFLSFLPTARSGLRVAHLCVAVLFFSLALSANRNVLLFLWVAGPMVCRNLAPLVTAALEAGARLRMRTWLRAGLMLGSIVGVGGLLLERAQEAQGEPSIAELAPFRVPEQAVDRLLALRLPRGPIFCSDRYGGYLAWRLFPGARPTMDGRLILRSAETYAEHLALGDHPQAFDEYRRRQRIETVMVPTSYPERFLPLVAWLIHQPSWRLLYTDGTQTLFVHDQEGRLVDRTLDLTAPATVRAIAHELEARYLSQPLVLARARLHLARLLVEIGATGAADELLGSLGGISADALRARLAYQAGETARAEALARALLARQPEEIESLCLLAVLAHERGDRREALGLVKRALAVDTFHPLARRILEAIQHDIRHSTSSEDRR